MSVPQVDRTHGCQACHRSVGETVDLWRNTDALLVQVGVEFEELERLLSHLLKVRVTVRPSSTLQAVSRRGYACQFGQVATEG